ncbi:PRTRC system protein C [Dysgonomonas sp. ZJ709]|uniref:PRTRC system protein C n=1 Tax=Dysgonomonas sp. ZJ709 TaxID=2709797 RepID=UPI0013ED50F5|nr:PRTRC system protein C [Dysgonomonas sp. ZJ709]
MAIEVTAIKREFLIDKSGIELEDPNPEMSVESIQQFYSSIYPELTTATVHKEFKGDKYVYTFKSIIGTKG